jgi:hypothetical protein
MVNLKVIAFTGYQNKPFGGIIYVKKNGKKRKRMP